MKHLKLTAILLTLSVALSAEAILSVGYNSGSTCASTLSSGSVLSSGASTPYAISWERMDIGPCSPSLTSAAPWVRASASPFQIGVDGLPATTLNSDSLNGLGISIHAAAEWAGNLEVMGGIGSAFLDFDLLAGGQADWFTCQFSLDGVGQSCPADPILDKIRHYAIPITFGELIPYDFAVSKYLSPWAADALGSSLSLINFAVVDANGNPISGVTVTDPTASVPESSSVWLLLGSTALLALRQRRHDLRG